MTQFIDADTSCWAEMAFVHLLSILADNCQLEYPENTVLHWPAPLSLLIVYLKSFIMFCVLTQLLAFGSYFNWISSLWSKTNNCDLVERHSVTDTMRVWICRSPMLRGWCVQHALYHHNQHHQEVHHLNTVSTVTIIRGPSAFLLRPGAAQLSKIHHNLDLDQGLKSGEQRIKAGICL